MTEKESKTKRFLDWAHHFYWIRELLISLGGGTAAEAWLGKLWLLTWEWKLAIWFSVSGILFWLILLISGRWERNKKSRDSNASEIIHDVKVHAGNAYVLGLLEACAVSLQSQLEALWHHWDNAGEKLIHPLNARLDTLKTMSADGAWDLINERRDFMVLYAHHLQRLKVDAPDFTSAVVTTGYPSDCEYHLVLSNLKQHIEKLEKESLEAWNKY